MESRQKKNHETKTLISCQYLEAFHPNIIALSKFWYRMSDGVVPGFQLVMSFDTNVELNQSEPSNPDWRPRCGCQLTDFKKDTWCVLQNRRVFQFCHGADLSICIRPQLGLPWLSICKIVLRQENLDFQSFFFSLFH